MGGRKLVLLLMLAGLTPAPPADAGAHESRFGYRLEYPDSWEAADPASLGAKTLDETEKELAGKLAEFVDLALMGPAKGGFKPNVIVVVSAERLDIRPETVSEQAEGLTKTLEAAGGAYTVLASAYTDIGPNKGIRVEGELLFGERRPPVRNLIAILPGREYTYTLTCTASAETFAALKPEFDAILAGFSIESAPKDAEQPPPLVWLLLTLAVAALLAVSWIRMQRIGRRT